MEQLLQVGVISSTHGIRGEVKVFPTTDDPDRFRKLKQVILDTGREQKGLEIEGVKFFKQFDQTRKMMKQMPGMLGGKSGKRGGFKLPF